MRLDRRGFLGTLAVAAAGMVLDPERLLWVPGQKTIFLPPVEVFSGNTFVTPEWVAREVCKALKNNIKMLRSPQRFVVSA